MINGSRLNEQYAMKLSPKVSRKKNQDTDFFENLVMEGGGVKAFAYVGVIKVLIEKELLDKIKRVGGCSAGAILALGIAAGLKTDELQNYFHRLNLPTFAKSRKKIIKKFFQLMLPFCKHNFGLHNTAHFMQIFQEIIKKATTVKGPDGKVLVEGDPNMTFQGWDAFRTNYPEKGLKDILLEACNVTTGHNEIFSASDSKNKNVPIALAVCASMAFPIFFKPVLIQDSFYIDGGLQNNCPYNLFEEGMRQFNPKTLILRLHSPEEKEPKKKKISDLLRYITAIVEAALETQNREYPYQEHTVYCNAGKTSTLKNLTEEEEETLMDEGIRAIREFLDNHYSHSYCSTPLFNISQEAATASFHPTPLNHKDADQTISTSASSEELARFLSEMQISSPSDTTTMQQSRPVTKLFTEQESPQSSSLRISSKEQKRISKKKKNVVSPISGVITMPETASYPEIMGRGAPQRFLLKQSPDQSKGYKKRATSHLEGYVAPLYTTQTYSQIPHSSNEHKQSATSLKQERYDMRTKR